MDRKIIEHDERGTIQVQVGLQERKLQGCQIDRGGELGDILQLCSRAPNLLTNSAPGRRPPGYAPENVKHFKRYIFHVGWE